MDVANKVIFIEDSKIPTGVAEVPLAEWRPKRSATKSTWPALGRGFFQAPLTGPATRRNFKKTWERTLRKAGVPYFRLYDLRSTPLG